MSAVVRLAVRRAFRNVARKHVIARRLNVGARSRFLSVRENSRERHDETVAWNASSHEFMEEENGRSQIVETRAGGLYNQCCSIGDLERPAVRVRRCVNDEK